MCIHSTAKAVVARVWAAGVPLWSAMSDCRANLPNDNKTTRGDPMHRLKLALVLGTLAALGMAAPAPRQTYPIRPVTLIVPWPAGGSSDLVMRALADATQKHLGQPFVIENKPGASGTLGPAQMVATAKPDGYTIAQMPITVFRLPFMTKVTFDPAKDFTYVAGLTAYTFGVVVKSDSQWKTFKDFVAYAKANPGKIR